MSPGVTPLFTLYWPEVDASATLCIGLLSSPLSLAFSAGNNWWWVPVVAPLLGAYLGGIIYIIFIGSSIPRKPQRLENSMVCEDHRITELPRTSPSMASPIAPSVQPVPPLSGAMPLERF